MFAWFVLVCACLLILFAVFARASIEAGEERFWFSYYLILVPPVAAVAIVVLLPNLGWVLRLSTGLMALVVMIVVLLQVPRAADYIHENPARFSAVLPAIAGLEKAYLAVWPTDPERLARHERKLAEWRALGR
jgi:hypothetical protein